jgi:xanthosine utilization system XapX-like protein
MTDQPKGDKPALTVVVQSWWTPAIAVVTLVVGLLVGYFIHPLVAKDAQPTQDVAAATTPVPSSTVAQVTGPTATIDPTLAAISSSADLMNYLISKTNHFQGNPDATVTLIEFSDFQ